MRQSEEEKRLLKDNLKLHNALSKEEAKSKMLKKALITAQSTIKNYDSLHPDLFLQALDEIHNAIKKSR